LSTNAQNSSVKCATWRSVIEIAARHARVATGSISRGGQPRNAFDLDRAGPDL
jgi:hypothetical protein